VSLVYFKFGGRTGQREWRKGKDAEEPAQEIVGPNLHAPVDILDYIVHVHARQNAWLRFGNTVSF
jgi:hypothetical protein